MSAASNRLMPALIAAATTSLVASAPMRHPKLLQPRPTTETSNDPILRVSISFSGFPFSHVTRWDGAFHSIVQGDRLYKDRYGVIGGSTMKVTFRFPMSVTAALLMTAAAAAQQQVTFTKDVA